MRTHGWGGRAPRSDAEAIERILDAAQEALDASGPEMSLADVARRLDVTRQTVYRYFPSVDELIVATANRATLPFVEQLVLHLRGIEDPAAACVESLAFVIDQLQHDRYLRIALALGTPSNRAADVTSPRAIEQGVGLLRSLDVDWHAHGYDEAMLREIMGHELRILQSLLVDPSDHDGRGDLRAYLDRWLTPAIRALPLTRVENLRTPPVLPVGSPVAPVR
jgi:AcrR family transcriptional regulator